jgi:hypothetical protein
MSGDLIYSKNKLWNSIKKTIIQWAKISQTPKSAETFPGFFVCFIFILALFCPHREGNWITDSAVFSRIFAGGG